MSVNSKTNNGFLPLQSKEWLELKVLDVKPELTQLGETLDEARDLLAAHDDVLRQLEVSEV